MNRLLANPGVPLLAFIAIAAAPAAGEVRVQPFAQASLLGGQYFLEGKAASFDGRASAFVAPVVRLTERSELVPVYAGVYQGTQDVQELAGGGVLTRERMTHSVSAAWVGRREFDALRLRAGSTFGLVRETTDEKWGDGLFDYRTLSAGLEGEHERPWGTVVESYDAAFVTYPNYDSLVSQSQGALDAQTFTELSNNAGTSVLDHVDHRLGLGLTLFPEPAVLRLDYGLTWSPYPDQAAVDRSGSFTGTNRSDLRHSLSARVSRRARAFTLGTLARVENLRSNQNSYDASRTKFIDRYYDYWEAALGPSLALAFKGGGGASFDTMWTQRRYSGRLAQDASGAYGSSRTLQTVWVTTLSMRWPLMKGLSARLTGSTLSSSSNMRYEANYRYNYQANTYLFGLEWEL